MRTAAILVLTVFWAGVASAAPPSHAQACNTPAAEHNPHCQGPVSTSIVSSTPRVSVPEPASLGMLGAGLAALYLARRRKAREDIV
jgi:hypothetical protein